MAATELPERCRALARESRVSFTSVSVRNQKSRWGACSPTRAITLNWRLIQMPPPVSDYVILHELSHVRHPNHSHRFWHEVERVCGWWKDAERWLRRHGGITFLEDGTHVFHGAARPRPVIRIPV